MSTVGSTNPSGRDEAHVALFSELVVQHVNMALIFVGAVPHPETGEPAQDLEAAQLFIDRLDMLEAKTRGNLGAQETALLKQSLTTARMAFVQAVERGAKPVEAQPAPTPTTPAVPPESSAAPAIESPAPADDSPAPPADERKKFVKKY